MATLETKTVSATCAGRMLDLGKAKTLASDSRAGK